MNNSNKIEQLSRATLNLILNLAKIMSAEVGSEVDKMEFEHNNKKVSIKIKEIN